VLKAFLDNARIPLQLASYTHTHSNTPYIGFSLWFDSLKTQRLLLHTYIFQLKIWTQFRKSTKNILGLKQYLPTQNMKHKYTKLAPHPYIFGFIFQDLPPYNIWPPLRQIFDLKAHLISLRSIKANPALYSSQVHHLPLLKGKATIWPMRHPLANPENG